MCLRTTTGVSRLQFKWQNFANFCSIHFFVSHNDLCSEKSQTLLERICTIQHVNLRYKQRNVSKTAKVSKCFWITMHRHKIWCAERDLDRNCFDEPITSPLELTFIVLISLNKFSYSIFLSAICLFAHLVINFQAAESFSKNSKVICYFSLCSSFCSVRK